MNTKGKKTTIEEILMKQPRQDGAGARRRKERLDKKGENSGRLQAAMDGLSDREVLAAFREHARLTGKVEKAAYSIESLDRLRSAARFVLKEYLAKREGTRLAMALMDELKMLDVWADEVDRGDGRVGELFNRGMKETVSKLERSTVKLGQAARLLPVRARESAGELAI